MIDLVGGVRQRNLAWAGRFAREGVELAKARVIFAVELGVERQAEQAALVVGWGQFRQPRPEVEERLAEQACVIDDPDDADLVRNVESVLLSRRECQHQRNRKTRRDLLQSDGNVTLGHALRLSIKRPAAHNAVRQVLLGLRNRARWLLGGSGFGAEVRLAEQEGGRDDKAEDFEGMAQFHGKQAGADHDSWLFDFSF